jgi:hypothetical protein
MMQKSHRNITDRDRSIASQRTKAFKAHRKSLGSNEVEDAFFSTCAGRHGPLASDGAVVERGRFIWPSPADGVVTISSAQLGYLLSSIDWRPSRRRGGRHQSG